MIGVKRLPNCETFDQDFSLMQPTNWQLKTEQLKFNYHLLNVHELTEYSDLWLKAHKAITLLREAFKVHKSQIDFAETIKLRESAGSLYPLLTWKEFIGLLHTVVGHKLENSVRRLVCQVSIVENQVKLCVARVIVHFFCHLACWYHSVSAHCRLLSSLN